MDTPRSNTTTIGTEPDSSTTPKYGQQTQRKVHQFPPPQHKNNILSMNKITKMQKPQRQRSAPIKNNILEINPIIPSKSHPDLISNSKNGNNGNNNNNNNINNKTDDEKSDNGGESTPVLSDINDIDRVLSSSNNNNMNHIELNEYDSDIQSEMSATPQPTDIANTIIPQFIPNSNRNAVTNIDANSSIPNIQEIGPIVDMAPSPPKIKTIGSEISNDADDEISSPGSTSTDNDTVSNETSGIIKIKSIKTLTPTPHKPPPHKPIRRLSQKRTSQIIIPKPVDQLVSGSITTTTTKTTATTNTTATNDNNESTKIEKVNEIENGTPMPKKKGHTKRPSWTEIAMEKIDVFVSPDTKREFTMIKPINQQQGVDNMIKEYRKSLGQNELQGSLEQLRKELASGSNTSGDDADNARNNSDDDENENIIDVQEQSDTTSSNQEDEEDSFLSDEDFEKMRERYIKITTPNSHLTSKKSQKSPLNLDTIKSNDTTSSRRYDVKKIKSKTVINNNINDNNNNINTSSNTIISNQSQQRHSNKSNSQRSHRSNGKRGSSHGSHHSHKSHSHKSQSQHSSHHSPSHRSRNSHKSQKSHKSHGSNSHHSQQKKKIVTDNGNIIITNDQNNDNKKNKNDKYEILSNSTTRRSSKSKSKSKSKHNNRRSSDSETSLLRRFTNDTTASNRYRTGITTTVTPQKNIPYYQYSNTTVQSKHRDYNKQTSIDNVTPNLDFKFGAFSNSTMQSRSSRHSRSSSDFLSTIDKIGGTKPPMPMGPFSQFRKQKSNPNQRYDYRFGGGSIGYDEERENSVMSMSLNSVNSNTNTNILSAGDNSPSTNSNSTARQYRRKKHSTIPNDEINNSLKKNNHGHHNNNNHHHHHHHHNNNQILRSFKSPPRSPRSPRTPQTPKTPNNSNNPPTKKKRIITSKCDQIRQNYIVRANYVDQHKQFSKYSSDRNKSWKKWIKLLQSHDSDITNVANTAQVQTLIDFARMSLGNYGNWLMMKRGINQNDSTGSQSSIHSTKSSSKSNQWITYFAIMRDFNLFLFNHQLVPSTLNDVVNEDYLALSVAHIENVRQCNSNSSELYLEVTGSKTNHKLKFRCESVEACQQWVAEMNYQIHIVSDLCCNQSLRLECADQKRSIWIPVAPMTQINPYLRSNISKSSKNSTSLIDNNTNKENDNNNNNNINNNNNNNNKSDNNNNASTISSLSAASKQHHKNSRKSYQ